MLSWEETKQRNLKETENLLRQAHCAKCFTCGFWMGEEYIKDNICLDCREKQTKEVG